MALTTHNLADLGGFTQKVKGEEAALANVFCCDLLSLVISRAPDDCAWVTVMGNVNTVAVATLCEARTLVVAEGMPADEDMIAAAERQGVSVYTTDLPVYEAAKRIDEAIRHAL